MPGISSDKGPPRASFIIDGRWRNELLLRALTGTSFFTMSTYIEDAGNLPWPKISPRLIYHRRALRNELLLRALTGTSFFTIRGRPRCRHWLEPYTVTAISLHHSTKSEGSLLPYILNIYHITYIVIVPEGACTS